MNCPKCNSKNIRTRDTKNPNRLVKERRLHCEDCGIYFKTVEHIMDDDVMPNIISNGERRWFRKSLFMQSICECVSYEKIFLGFARRLAETYQDIVVDSPVPPTTKDIETFIINNLVKLDLYHGALTYALKYCPERIKSDFPELYNNMPSEKPPRITNELLSSYKKK